MSDRTNQPRIRILGGLSLLGGLTGLLVIAALANSSWGQPGTLAYQRYELLNRLMSGSLLLMTAGWIGALFVAQKGGGRWGALLALTGTIIMLVGSAAEFWLFSDLPYADGGNMRDLSFAAFSLGGLIQDIGAAILGIDLWRSWLWPRWAALLLIVALPLDFAAFFWLESIFIVPVLLALVLGWNLLFHKHRLPQRALQK